MRVLIWERKIENSICKKKKPGSSREDRNQFWIAYMEPLSGREHNGEICSHELEISEKNFLPDLFLVCDVECP